ncbi:MAG: hypothetical protein ACJ8DC_02225 [Gemmatimonadales bacterium]
MRTLCAQAVLYTLFALAVVPRSGVAQWTLAAEIGSARFWGGSAEVGGDRSFRPYRPTLVGLGLGYTGSNLGVGVRVHYAGSSLALEGKEAVVASKGVLDVYGISPEISLPVTRLGLEGRVRLYAGPLIELWKLANEISHLRLGAAAAVAFEVPLGVRLAGTLRAGMAVTPASPFAREDLDSSYEPRALWRRTLSASLAYRL